MGLAFGQQFFSAVVPFRVCGAIIRRANPSLPNCSIALAAVCCVVHVWRFAQKKRFRWSQMSSRSIPVGPDI
jgi:hypothetical protein